jgi:subtilisin family serine protease
MPEDVAAEVALRTNGRVGYVYENVLQGFSITMPRAARTGTVQDPRVAYIEEDIPVTIFAQTTPTGVNRIFANTSALDIDETDDKRVDVDVAILDTGIDRQHPDLYVVGGANCLKTTGNGPAWRRTSYCDDTEDGDDDHYHGTHVAGSAGALDNGFGVVGVAPGARLWAVKVLDSQGSGTLSGIIAGIDWVVANTQIEKPAVINMSLGGSGTSSAMNDAIENAVLKGVAVVVSAGNSDDDAANYTPANAPDAITVSALADFDGLPNKIVSPTCRTDQDDTLADFSNWGAIDIAAPGVCIFSAFPIERGEYGTISGTSMASPHVAGAAALLASKGDAPQTIRQTLLIGGNYDWIDDSGDGVHEPLLDISGTAFVPTLVSSDGGGGTNNPPTARFTHHACVVDENCAFDGSSSSDDDGTITDYAWDFDGDGDTDANGVTVDYIFTSSGTKIVKLTVTDDGSLTGSSTQEVSVSSGSDGAQDACDGMANGVYLSPSSTSQGRNWTAIVDAVNCLNGEVTNFGSVSLSWSPEVGTVSNDCSTSTGVCQATQSGIRKNTGSVQFTINDETTVISKP